MALELISMMKYLNIIKKLDLSVLIIIWHLYFRQNWDKKITLK